MAIGKAVQAKPEVKATANTNKTTNKMRNIKIEKVTLNIGAGVSPEDVDKAFKLLQIISGKKPIQTITQKRVATWKLRPGLPLGAKVTIRGKEAEELLKRLLAAVENKVSKKSFAENGFSFGIKEYIEIPGVKYVTEIGIIGLDVCVTLERPGFRVKRKRLMAGKIGKGHRISIEDTKAFAQEKLGVKVE